MTDFSRLSALADFGMLSVDRVFQVAKHFGLKVSDYNLVIEGPKQGQTFVELLLENRATGACSVLDGFGQRGASFLTVDKVRAAFQAAM